MSYRQLFDEAIGQSPPSGVDLDRVIHRQRRAARLRPVLAGVALVAMAAGTTMFVAPEDEDPVVVPADEFAGFPEYLYGTRVIAAESADIADRTLTLTFTPSSSNPVLWTRCDTPLLDDWNLGLRAELSVGAGVVGGVDFCSGFDVKLLEAVWTATGLEVGRPITITVTLREVVPVVIDTTDLPPLPTEGTFALAAAEPVPFEEYVFPPRPDSLAPLPDPQTEGVLVEVRADSDDPNRPVEQTFVWEDPMGGCGATQLELDSQTPGRLRVVVNGVEVGDGTWWDYEQRGQGATDLSRVCDDFEDGQVDTVRVEPEHMTGDWRVLLTQRGG